MRHFLIETVDPSYTVKIQRKLSDLRKKKPIRISIIDETVKQNNLIVQQNITYPIENQLQVNEEQNVQENIKMPITNFDFQGLDDDKISPTSERKSPKKGLQINISPLNQGQEEGVMRSNSENLKKLPKENIDSFNPFLVDQLLGINTDINDIVLSDNNSNQSPMRTLSQDAQQNRQSLEIKQDNFLSPTKLQSNLLNKKNSLLINTTNYQSSQMSPQSSCVSSFYIDRIDELLPEKRLVTEKLFKSKDQNGIFVQPTIINQDDTPLYKSQNQNIRASQFMPRKFFFNSKYLTEFQQKKEFLKFQLQFRSVKEFEKDQHKKQKAQSLKFLRKLGLKLRKPANVRPNRNFNVKRQSDGQSVSNYQESPIKSVFLMGSPELKISPRQALLQKQQMQEKNNSNDQQDGFQGFQLHLTGASEDNNSSCGNSSAKYRDLFKGNNQSEVPPKKQKSQKQNDGEQTPQLSPTFDRTPVHLEIPNQSQQNSQKNADDMQWTVTFHAYENFDAINELLEMQSPIATRNQVRPELDELEAQFMDAFDEFRQDNMCYEFNNYKNYYQDALQQNIQQSLGANEGNLKVHNVPSRDRDSSVSFKDKRFFVQNHNGENSRKGSMSQTFPFNNLQEMHNFSFKQQLLMKQKSIDSNGPFDLISSRQIVEVEETKENDSPKCSLKNTRKQSQLSPSHQKVMNLNLKILDQLTDMSHDNLILSQNHSHHEQSQKYLKTEVCDEQYYNDSPYNVEGPKRRSLTLERIYEISPINKGQAANKTYICESNQLYKDGYKKQGMRKSRSRKRCTTRFNQQKSQDKYYLDPNALKQMSKNLKLLCDDLIESKPGTTTGQQSINHISNNFIINNKKPRQPTQTKNNHKLKGSYLTLPNQPPTMQKDVSFQSNQSGSQYNLSVKDYQTIPQQQQLQQQNQSFTFVKEGQTIMPYSSFTLMDKSQHNNSNSQLHLQQQLQNQNKSNASLLVSNQQQQSLKELSNSYNRGIQYVMRKYQSAAFSNQHNSMSKLIKSNSSNSLSKRSPKNKQHKQSEDQSYIQLKLIKPTQ